MCDVTNPRVGPRFASHESGYPLDIHSLGMDSSDTVSLVLTRDEALVLFDWLSDTELERVSLPLRHHAERVASWNLCALLESLVEPFDGNYASVTADARSRLTDSN